MLSMVPEVAKSRVLVVEDERPLLSYLSTLLSREYEVHTAQSTAEAETILQDNDVQVVLCDHDMPGEKGLDFLSRMRNVRPKTQRILLTGHAETEVFLKAINEGDVLKFLVKPSSMDEIRRAVELGLEEHGRLVESEEIEQEN
ncbi:MAG: response regulator, partial [Verrucomicrobiales bacterium]